MKFRKLKIALLASSLVVGGFGYVVSDSYAVVGETVALIGTGKEILGSIGTLKEMEILIDLTDKMEKKQVFLENLDKLGVVEEKIKGIDILVSDGQKMHNMLINAQERIKDPMSLAKYDDLYKIAKHDLPNGLSGLIGKETVNNIMNSGGNFTGQTFRKIFENKDPNANSTESAKVLQQIAVDSYKDGMDTAGTVLSNMADESRTIKELVDRGKDVKSIVGQLDIIRTLTGHLTLMTQQSNVIQANILKAQIAGNAIKEYSRIQNASTATKIKGKKGVFEETRDYNADGTPKVSKGHQEVYDKIAKDMEKTNQNYKELTGMDMPQWFY